MNSDCEWIINIAPGKFFIIILTAQVIISFFCLGNKVNLNFINFDLISTENCNADYVEIREKDAGGKLLGITVILIICKEKCYLLTFLFVRRILWKRNTK